MEIFKSVFFALYAKETIEIGIIILHSPEKF